MTSAWNGFKFFWLQNICQFFSGPLYCFSVDAATESARIVATSDEKFREIYAFLILPAVSVSCAARGCRCVLQRDIDSPEAGLNTIVLHIRSFSNSGYHGWVGQRGIMIISVTPSCMIFFRVGSISANDGKA